MWENFGSFWWEEEISAENCFKSILRWQTFGGVLVKFFVELFMNLWRYFGEISTNFFANFRQIFGELLTNFYEKILSLKKWNCKGTSYSKWCKKNLKQASRTRSKVTLRSSLAKLFFKQKKNHQSAQNVRKAVVTF